MLSKFYINLSRGSYFEERKQKNIKRWPNKDFPNLLKIVIDKEIVNLGFLRV